MCCDNEAEKSYSISRSNLKLACSRLSVKRAQAREKTREDEGEERRESSLPCCFQSRSQEQANLKCPNVGVIVQITVDFIVSNPW